jgi:hypothetical protein
MQGTWRELAASSRLEITMRLIDVDLHFRAASYRNDQSKLAAEIPASIRRVVLGVVAICSTSFRGASAPGLVDRLRHPAVALRPRRRDREAKLAGPPDYDQTAVASVTNTASRSVLNSTFGIGLCRGHEDRADLLKGALRHSRWTRRPSPARRTA